MFGAPSKTDLPPLKQQIEIFADRAPTGAGTESKTGTRRPAARPSRNQVPGVSRFTHLTPPLSPHPGSGLIRRIQREDTPWPRSARPICSLSPWRWPACSRSAPHPRAIAGSASWPAARFDGPKLRAPCCPAAPTGSSAGPTASTTLDVRIVLQTDDGAAIGMTYRGMRHGPAAVMERMTRGEFVDPSEYYFRTGGNVRDRRAEIRLAEPDHRHRHGQPPAGRPGLRNVRGALTWRRSDSSASATWARPMAANLVKAGHAVTGYDLEPGGPAGARRGRRQDRRQRGGGGERRRGRHHHAAGRRAGARRVAAPGRADRGGEGRQAAADRLLHHRRRQRPHRHRGGGGSRAWKCWTPRSRAARSARRTAR